MSIRTFFSKSVGLWESHRTYMYPNKGADYSITIFQWDIEDEHYKVKWNNPKLNSEGEMIITLCDAFKFYRNIGYFTSDATECKIISSSNTYLRTHTTYNGMLFDEWIEFVTDDLRSRRTVAYKLNKDGTKFNKVILIGSYVEKRLCTEEKGTLEKDMVEK